MVGGGQTKHQPPSTKLERNFKDQAPIRIGGFITSNSSLSLATRHPSLNWFFAVELFHDIVQANRNLFCFLTGRVRSECEDPVGNALVNSRRCQPATLIEPGL